MKKTTLIITALSLLVVAVLMISGFRGGITGGAITCNTPYILVGTDCCLDSNDNKICDKDETAPNAEPVEPPREEIIETPVIGAPQELPEDQFAMMPGDSIEFEGKTVMLVDIEDLEDLESDNPPKGIYNVGGIEREVQGTKETELVNGIKITNMKYLKLGGFIVKLEKLVLGEDEYLMNTREDVIIQGKTFYLYDITESEGIKKITLHIDGVDKLVLQEGETEEFAGLKITNLYAFPSGYKLERQAIIKVQ